MRGLYEPVYTASILVRALDIKYTFTQSCPPRTVWTLSPRTRSVHCTKAVEVELQPPSGMQQF